jgi:hypothetical protein
LATSSRRSAPSLPGATVYVYDNNSTDRTIAMATAAGAICRTEPQQGKGNVVRRMLADLEADVYVILAGTLVVTYLETGLVPRLPAAVLVTGLAITDC